MTADTAPEEQESVEETQAVAQAEPEHAESIQEEKNSKALSDQEHNWREARRKMEELDRKNRELEEQLARMNKPQPTEEDDLGLSDEDIAEGKHLRKLRKEIRELKKSLQEKEASTLDDRLLTRYPDFQDVVTTEAIETLKKNEPELATSLMHIPDPYKQGIAAYKMVKKLGLAPEPSVTMQKSKAEANSKKPVSVNAVAKQSAIGNAHLFENGLTPALKQQLWQEMQDAMKRA